MVHGIEACGHRGLGRTGNQAFVIMAWPGKTGP